MTQAILEQRAIFVSYVTSKFDEPDMPSEPQSHRQTQELASRILVKQETHLDMLPCVLKALVVSYLTNDTLSSLYFFDAFNLTETTKRSMTPIAREKGFNNTTDYIRGILNQAWDSAAPNEKDDIIHLAHQRISLTMPASFEGRLYRIQQAVGRLFSHPAVDLSIITLSLISLQFFRVRIYFFATVLAVGVISLPILGLSAVISRNTASLETRRIADSVYGILAAPWRVLSLRDGQIAIGIANQLREGGDALRARGERNSQRYYQAQKQLVDRAWANIFSIDAPAT